MIFVQEIIYLKFVSISAFAPLVGNPIGIASSVVGLKNGTITAGIKKYNSVIKKKNMIALFPKTKLNSTEVLISRTLIDLYISHDELVSVNVL